MHVVFFSLPSAHFCGCKSLGWRSWCRLCELKHDESIIVELVLCFNIIELLIIMSSCSHFNVRFVFSFLLQVKIIKTCTKTLFKQIEILKQL